MSLITLEQADGMNDQSKSVTYWDVETCKSELTFLQHLLNQKKFIDLKIKVSMIRINSPYAKLIHYNANYWYSGAE